MWNKGQKGAPPAPAVVYLSPAPPKLAPHAMPYEQWFLWVLKNDWRAFVGVEKQAAAK